MLDNLVQKFTSSGSTQDAYKIVYFCRTNNIFALGYFLGKYLCSIFPHNWNLLNETGLCAFYHQQYEESYKLFERALSMRGLTRKEADNVIFNAHFCTQFISDLYTTHNSNIVHGILQRKSKGIPLVTFTITTCKRYDLFEKTMNSFLNCCIDLDRIDAWLCVDDNSSSADREKMTRNYPFFDFYFKTPQEKGHPQSMNIILDKVDTPYIFHIEDDWKFFAKRNYITELLDILNEDSGYGQALINKNYTEIDTDINIVGGIPKTTSTGLRYFEHEFVPTQEDMNKFYKKYGPGRQSAYWPHFSMRPSLHRTSVWKDLGSFNETVSHFEMEYAYRYVKAGYKSVFLESIYCLHIGRLTSEIHDTSKLNAYALNNEAQFAGKEEKTQKEEKTSNSIKFKFLVLNLDRRPDRWAKFTQNDIGLNYTRYSAIDGDKLKSTPQLLRIFDSNDYNMRAGMVGCAMSHIKMYTELIHSQFSFFCIMEDDVETVPDFKNKFIHVLKTIPNDWDIIYLGHHYRPNLHKPEYYDKTKNPKVEKWSRHRSLQESLGGTGGYLITRQGAEKLLNFINRTGMTNCIDTMQQKAADEMNIYYCTPHLVYSECWTGDNNPDTDIQFNYNSLSVDIDKRLVEELEFYRDEHVRKVVDFDKMKSMVQNPEVVLFYHDVPTNILRLQQLCKVPNYTLDNRVLVVVPNPKKDRYFHRFKRNDSFNIDDAIQYK